MSVLLVELFISQLTLLLKHMENFFVEKILCDLNIISYRQALHQLHTEIPIYATTTTTNLLNDPRPKICKMFFEAS